MAVTMGLGARIYTYGAKAYGYASRAIGLNNSFSRQLASANRNVLEGSSIDFLRALKREQSPKYWNLFIKDELKGMDKLKYLGILEKEQLYVALEPPVNLRANTWLEYIQNLIKNNKLSKDATYRDMAKAFMND